MSFDLTRIGGCEAQNALLTRAIETAVHATIIADMDGRIVFWSPSAASVYGYSCDQAVGRLTHELIVPGYNRDGYLATLAKFQTTGQSRLIGQWRELDTLHASGHIFKVEAWIALIEVDGQRYFVSRANDVTSRLEHERRLLNLAGEMAQKAPILDPHAALEAQLSQTAREEALNIVVEALERAQDILGKYVGQKLTAVAALQRLNSILSGNNAGLLIAKHFFQPLTKKAVRPKK